MIHTLAVGVALERPPRIDEFRRYDIEAVTEFEATLIALHMSACTSVMPVWAGWVDDVPHVPKEWLR